MPVVSFTHKRLMNKNECDGRIFILRFFGIWGNFDVVLRFSLSTMCGIAVFSLYHV